MFHIEIINLFLWDFHIAKTENVQCIFHLCLRYAFGSSSVGINTGYSYFLSSDSFFLHQLNFILVRSSNPFSALSLLNRGGEILITIGEIGPRIIIDLPLKTISLNAILPLHVISHLWNLVAFTDVILIVKKFWRKIAQIELNLFGDALRSNTDVCLLFLFQKLGVKSWNTFSICTLSVLC